VQARLLKLLELQKERQDHNLKLLTNTVEAIIKRTNFLDIDPGTVVQEITMSIQKSSLNNRTKKILEFPVVREELLRASSNSIQGKDILIQNIVETLIPFLAEAVMKEDSETVHKHSQENAREELTNVLIPVYMSILLSAVRKAKMLDAFIHDSIISDDKIARGLENECQILTRQAISIDYGPDNYPYKCGKYVPLSVYALVKTFARRKLDKLLNTAIKNEIPAKYDFNGHSPISELYKDVHKRCLNLVDMECNKYSQLHQSFSMQNSTSLQDFAINLLQTEYKDLTTADIESLLKHKPKISDLKVYYGLSNLKTVTLSDRLKSFQSLIDEEVIERYGFFPGAFIYSKTYFNLLEAILNRTKAIDRPHTSSKVEL